MTYTLPNFPKHKRKLYYILAGILLFLVVIRDFNKLYHKKEFWHPEYKVRNYHRSLLPTKKIVPFHAKFSISLLESSKYKQDFFTIAPVILEQRSKKHSGIVVIQAVLNSLKNQSLLTKEQPKFSRMYTQNKILKTIQSLLQKDAPANLDATKKTKATKTIVRNSYKKDLSLQRIEQAFDYYELGATVVPVKKYTKLNIKNFRKTAKTILSKPDSFIIAYFHYRALGFNFGKARYAIISAYNQKSDRMLLVHGNQNYNSWFWVKTSDLLFAMTSKEGSTGYVTVFHNRQTLQPEKL